MCFLERGYTYEFRVSARNGQGYGVEGIEYIKAPDGPPEGPPHNITWTFQTPTTLAITWDPPPQERRNGRITGYHLQYHKLRDRTLQWEKNTTLTKVNPIYINMCKYL